MMLTRSRLLAALLASLTLSAAARADEAIDGFWMDSHGEVILQIRPCGDAHCGRVAWLRLPNGPDGQEILDYRNPDPALRDRPVCGLDVVTGFKPQPDGTWGDGTVYVSDLGSSFSGYAEILGQDQVKVTGYVFIPLIGQSEVWSRVKHDFELCWAKPGAKAAAILQEGKQATPAAAKAEQASKASKTAEDSPAAEKAPKKAAAPAPAELKSTKTD